MVLTDKQRRFVEEYVRDWNATQAALRAGYAQKAAYKQGSDNLKHPHIKAEIDKERKRLRENAELTTSMIVHELRDMVTADPRDLIELRRDCCRFCYGKDYRYQETPAERRARWDAHQAVLKVTPEKELKRLPEFDEMGGVGFNPKRPPVEDCPECFGDGIEKVIARDTRFLSPAAAKLYRGVKVTKEGYEIKMRDADRSVDKAGQYLAMWGGDKAPSEGGIQTTGPQPMSVRGVRPKREGEG